MAHELKNKHAETPILENETKDVTVGCRHAYPDICKNNGATKICAFSRKDGFCLKPPLSWKKRFKEYSTD